MPYFLHKTFHKPRTSCDVQALAPFLFQKLHFSQLKSSEMKSILVLIISVMRNLIQCLDLSNKNDSHWCEVWLFWDDELVVLIEVRLFCGFEEDDMCGSDRQDKNRDLFLDCLEANEGIVQAQLFCYWIIIVFVCVVFSYLLHHSELSFQIHQLQHELRDFLEDMDKLKLRLPWLTNKIYEDIPVIFQWRLGEWTGKVNLGRLKRKSLTQSNQYTNLIHLQPYILHLNLMAEVQTWTRALMQAERCFLDLCSNIPAHLMIFKEGQPRILLLILTHYFITNQSSILLFFVFGLD